MMAIYRHVRRKALDDAAHALEPDGVTDVDIAGGHGIGAGYVTCDFITASSVEQRARFSKKTSGPSRTRTCDLLVRSQTLYPTELWAPEEGQNFKSYHCSIRS